MSKLKTWIQTARLRTLPLSASGILTATAAAKYSGDFSVTIMVLALLTTLGFQILSNFANDYGDGIKGTDNLDRIGPARAFQSGALSAAELKRGMWTTAVITFLLSCLLIYIAFGKSNTTLSLVYLILGILAIVSAITYTVGRWAYGYRALGDLFVFLFFGLVGVAGCYVLYTQRLDPKIFAISATIGLMSAAVLNLNNMRDRTSDTKAGKTTLAVLLGPSKIKHYHLVISIVAIACAVYYLNSLNGNWITFLPLLAFIPLLVNIVKVYRNKNSELLDPELKKVAISTFLFSLLFVVSAFIN